MSFRWDNIEILRAIDRIQGDTYHGGPIQGLSGLQLMEQVGGKTVADQRVTGGFVQELHIARDLGLLTFRVQGDFRQVEQETNPHWYVQNLWDFALTVAGQDRARGQMIIQPPPDPAEDDGRQLSDLIIRRVAASIAEQYAADEVAVFLAEEGIPPVQMPVPVGTGPCDAHALLAALWRWGSEGRRMSRRFLGRWLDDCLLSGPDAELRAALIEQLARQGWRVRESDSVLVISEPTRGVPVSAPFLRASRLHPIIESEARPQFLIGKPEQGVFASMRAVEIRVRRVAGLGEDVTGVDLMNRAFGPNGSLTDTSAVRGEQEGTRMLFAGAYAVFRNPAGHRQVDYTDLSEAAEAVQTASLLMRILDRVEDRLLAVARGAARPAS
ncbi:MAG TPA: TIGR02391 family protein [Streptosporangiaceae bacterium]|jgi:uncharacterized protein (TIGR02391 family)